MPSALKGYIDSFFRESATRVPEIITWLGWFWDTHHQRFTVYLSQKIVEVSAVGVLVFLIAWLVPQSRLSRVASLLLVLGSLLAVANFHRWARPKATDPFPYAEALAKDNSVLRFLQNHDRERYFFHYFLGDADDSIGLTPNENATYGIPAINGYTNLVPRRSELESPVFRVSFGQPYPDNMLKLLSIRYSLVLEDQPGATAAWRRRMKVVVRQPPYVLLEYPGALSRYYFPRRIRWMDRASTVEAVRNQEADPLSLTSAVGTRAPYALPDRCLPRYEIVGAHLSERQLRVDNPCGSSVWMSVHMPQHPWWRVYRDGDRLPYEEANVLHRLVEIPPGRHVIDLKCVPVSWWVGIFLSAFTLLAMGVTALFYKRTRVT